MQLMEINSLTMFYFICQKTLALIGKEVLPTYSYARLYTEGEILSKHKDRPSCEISVTYFRLR